MATENLGKCVSLPVAADLSSYQYRFVKVDTSARAALCGDGQKAVGVLQDDPAAAGRPGNVMVGIGVTKVVVAGAITMGDAVSSDSQGRANTAASGDYVVGIALETSTTAGQIISILWQPCPAIL